MKEIFSRMDKPLFFLTLLLSSIGVVMVFSASNVASILQYKVSTYYFFEKQLLIVALMFVIGLGFLVKFPISKYDKLKSLLVLSIIASLAFLPVYGKITNGANSWYRIGFFSVQPSEFAKSVVIIYMASYFGKNVDNKGKYFFLRPIIVCAIIAGLIFLEPDLGTAAIIGLTVFLMFWAIPFSKRRSDVKIFKIIGFVFICAVILLMTMGGKILNEEQSSRLIYKDPCTRYIQKTGYQVCNGMIAMNNGGLKGVGLGNSTQKYLYLPEAHTDFIFPIIVEELGLISGIGIIMLYVLILFRILKIAKSAKNLTSSLMAYGTFIVILLHILINLGGILALIPLTGVPLPLLSYGGSITINTLLLIFICLRISIESNIKKEKKLRKA